MKKRKTVNVQVMLTPTEAKQLKAEVGRRNTTVSEFVRGLIKREVEVSKQCDI